MRVIEWIFKVLDSKAGVGIVGALAGAVLMKYLPSTLTALANAGLYVIRRFSRTAAHRDFRNTYLDWLVTEHRELKLAGVVTADESKKPTLEQVFVSLDVGKQTATSARDLEVPHIQSRAGLIIRTWNDFAEALELHRNSALARHPDYKHWVRLCQRQIWHRRRLLTSLDLSEVDTADIAAWLRDHRDALDSELLTELQLRKVLRSMPRIAILGAPGSGKTTLLQYLALTYARERAGDPVLRKRGILAERIGESTWRLPIFLRLSSIAQQLEMMPPEQQRRATLLDVLLLLLAPDLQARPVAAAFFRTELERGNCIIFLDGLDEIPSQTSFETVVRVIRSFMVAHRENHFVVTSRIVGWRGGISSDYDVFYVNNLSEKQVGVFVETWYSAVERNAVIGPLSEEGRALREEREQRASRRASELRAAIRDNEGLRRLATNPMLLSIIALVHRTMATLPKERGKLYSQCTRILLEQWDIQRGVRVDDTQLKVEQKEAVMRRIALAFHRGEIGAAGGSREARTEDVSRVLGAMLPDLGHSADQAEHLLRILIARSGIIVERQRGILSFSHHTFQEYFAAGALAAGSDDAHRQHLLHPDRLWSDWWREVILLYAGTIEDASAFVKQIYLANRGDFFLDNVRLAAACMSEAISVSDAAVRETVLRELFAIRQGGAPVAAQPLSRAATEYLLQWAKGPQWLPAAAVARFHRSPHECLAKGGGALVSALQDPAPAARRAAFGVLRHLDAEALRELAPVACSLAREVQKEDPVLVAEVVGRVASFAPSPEAIDLLLRQAEGAAPIVAGALRTMPADLLTMPVAQALVRFLPRAPEAVGSAIVETIRRGSDHVVATGAVRHALTNVAGDDSSSGAAASVLALAMEYETGMPNLARRLLTAADVGDVLRRVTVDCVRVHASLVGTLLAAIEKPTSADEISAALDLLTDAFDQFSDVVQRRVRALVRNGGSANRAAVARACARCMPTDGFSPVDFLLRHARSLNDAVRTNAMCALAWARPRTDEERRRTSAVLASSIRSSNAAARAAAAFTIARSGDDSLRRSLVAGWVPRPKHDSRGRLKNRFISWIRRRPPELTRWCELVELRYVLETAVTLEVPDVADLLLRAWPVLASHLAEGGDRNRVAELMGERYGRALPAQSEQRLEMRHTEWRHRDRMTLLEEDRAEHLRHIHTSLVTLCGRDPSGALLPRLSEAAISASADVSALALALLGQESLQIHNADVVVDAIRNAFGHRLQDVRAAGTQAADRLSARLHVSVASELLTQLSDDDAEVRDIAWGVLTARFPPALYAPADPTL